MINIPQYISFVFEEEFPLKPISIFGRSARHFRTRKICLSPLCSLPLQETFLLLAVMKEAICLWQEQENLTDEKQCSFSVCFLIKSIKPKICQSHFPFWNASNSPRAECYSLIILSTGLQIMLFGINDHLRHANISPICFHNNWHAAI